jgi:phosphoglycolate phosphatase-like HAD superfamily hydrolase
VARLVIFDFSGVIVNDLRESWQALSKIVSSRGYIPDDLRSFRRNFKLPYWEYLESKGFMERQLRDPKIVDDYVRFYLQAADHIKLFGDAEEVLAAISNLGKEIAIVSHSPRKIIMSSLQRFRLDRYVKSNCIFALGDFKREKPFPDSIQASLGKLGYDTKEALYLGDMREDVIAARSARVTSVAICTEGSYHVEEILEQENPDFLVHGLREILPIIE